MLNSPLRSAFSLPAGTFLSPAARVGSGYLSDVGPGGGGGSGPGGGGGNPDSFTAEEYWTWHSSKPSPSVLSKMAVGGGPGQSAVGTHAHAHRGKVTRKLSADSLLDYKTYQMGDPVPDLLQADQRTNIGVQTLGRGGVGGGGKISHSHSSLSTISAPGTTTTGPKTHQRQRSLDATDNNNGSSSNNNGDVKSNAARLRELQLGRKPLQIKMDEFKPYQPEVENRKLQSYDTKLLDGLLVVHIYCGHGLKSSKTMLRDLYCVLEADGVNKARTMIRTGAINFDWDEAFEVDLENAREVSFLVYSWDPSTRHRLCFSGSLLLNSFIGQGNPNKIALKLEPKGVLYLECQYKEPSVSLQRTPSIRKNALFGVDLEVIIKREKSGSNVPILVRRCIDEVERRGLDHVGIYRLCGSAKRKAVLKDELERNPRAVDISQDGVSDINVVSGTWRDVWVNVNV